MMPVIYAIISSNLPALKLMFESGVDPNLTIGED